MFRRWVLMDKVLIVSLVILILFAWWDSKTLIGIKKIDAAWNNPDKLWDIFWSDISPSSFLTWLGILAAIGFIWYLYSKDKSESLAIFLTPAILIYFGVQDIVYFIFSPDTLIGSVGCWADVINPIRIISDYLGESCPTARSFILSATLGVVLAYFIYGYLKKQKW